MTAKTVCDIASQAFADAIDICQLIETLEALNSTEAIERINAAGTAAVAECIYRSLWSRLVLIVTRPYVNSRPGDLHAQRAFDLLKEESVRSEIENVGDRGLLDGAITLWAKCRGDHRLQSISDFRDKQIAHWGQPKNQPPIVNDIFDVSRTTANALTRLANGTGVVTLSLDSQLKGFREKANQFWQNRPPE